MKTLLTILTLILLASCAPGRWIPGNAKHFAQRKQAKELKKAKSEFDNKQRNNSIAHR